MQEKNIEQFNNDINNHNGYIYSLSKLSAEIATKRQTDEIIKLIKKHYKNKLKILDLGCGDGKMTMELYRYLSPNLIIGIDAAENAINLANKNTPRNLKNIIRFEIKNVYNLDKYKLYKFDLIIIRGVLHHLYNPINLIDKLNKISDNVLILEPNGYSPILKVIEKFSRYHILHEEKSYFPFLLNRWFLNNNYKVLEHKVFGIVPYFCTDSIAKFLKKFEPIIERFWGINNFYCGSNITLYRID